MDSTSPWPSLPGAEEQLFNNTASCFLMNPFKKLRSAQNLLLSFIIGLCQCVTNECILDTRCTVTRPMTHPKENCQENEYPGNSTTLSPATEHRTRYWSIVRQIVSTNNNQKKASWATGMQTKHPPPYHGELTMVQTGSMGYETHIRFQETKLMDSSRTGKNSNYFRWGKIGILSHIWSNAD